MIHIVRGSRQALARVMEGRYPSSQNHHLTVELDFLLPWAGARAWLANLRARFGDAAVEHALAPHRAALSVVLRGLVPLLTEEERARRDRLRARLPGFMSHSRIASMPLAEAWVDVLASLLRGDTHPVVIPDVGALDRETLSLLRHLLRRLPAAERPGVVLGHVAPEGVQAGKPAPLADPVIAMLEGFPDTIVEHVDERGDGAPLTTPVVPVDPLDDRAERRAWEALRAVDGPISEQLRDEVVGAIRAAFGAFGFVAAKRLGLELLERSPALPAALAAELHTLVAVSAYGLKVRGRDTGLAELLERHLSAALAAEEDPARRSHLLYRLCTNAPRLPGGRASEGLEYAERALREASAPGIPAGESAYLDAWARNGRAFVYSMQKRYMDAAGDCERAEARLAEVAPGDGATERDLVATRIVVRDNLAELYLLCGDYPRAERWQQALQEAEADLGDVMPFSPHRWLRILRPQGRAQEAVQRAEEGAAAASRHINPLAYDRFVVELGELRYRLGEASAAHRCFVDVLAVRRRLGEPDEIWRAEISAAQAALRAGLPGDAAAGFRRALASPACAGASARAELTAALALVAAARGDVAAAQAQVTAAIADAVAGGQRGALVRVARTAGEVYLRFGAKAEAREAFARALRLAEAEPRQDGAPPGPAALQADVVSALLGLGRAGDERPERTLRALALLPDALADAEAWWELPQLLAEVVPLVGDPALETRELRAALAIAVRAAEQRQDAREQVAAIRARR